MRRHQGDTDSVGLSAQADRPSFASPVPDAAKGTLATMSVAKGTLAACGPLTRHVPKGTLRA
jgi:hypothetical protein